MTGRPATALVFVLALAAAAAAGCSSRDLEKALHAGGKIAYDSMKAAKAPRSR